MFRKEFTSEEIVAGLMSFDPKIYKHLDSVYCKNVIKYVRSNSGTHEDGEELYQDVIFEVFLNVEQGKYKIELSQFSTYFMMIARNRWKDKLRKKRSAISTTSLEDSPLQLSATDDMAKVDQDYYNKLAKVMRLCIAQLNEEEQEMIRLYYYAKMSLEAVATQMNISYKYAKQKLYRIRQKLKKLLGDYPELSFQ